MKYKATSFDIAYKAGVSQSTVSRALRNSPLVNEETRHKIHAIAKELNYKVDKNASNLRSQHTGTLALLLFEDPTMDDSLINPFFLSMLGSITRAAAKKGYDLLISFQQLSDDWHADYEDASKADGIILLGYGDYLDYEEKLEKLYEQGTHFVRYGSVAENQPGVSFGCDNYQGGYMATQHLIKLGRKDFIFLGGASDNSPEFRARYQGYCQALKEAGLRIRDNAQLDAISTEESGYQAAQQAFEQKIKFDAVICASDLIAIGGIRAIKAHGLTIPTDVSIVGFDDIPIAHFANPPLTTIQQNTRLAGEMLVDALINLIHNLEVKASLTPATLIVRESCGSEQT
ncbi:LacI family DNA-binding transcriptional regulator [Catenovulum adriaticum]|uniref:LacI family DNA-binding transcriptional regulator n=1 Tax=Catenovulum adriaticum TaxID=2984846 RepID=A0ABY7AQ22_9ALTE|nr:LacI family DNA-binding transcriptional regulator [Catenovulum sp. TS8]WAJ71348.1 LacI family DNA-binding transcriptional regulator [Catenovulum sp. TS8]